MARFISSLLVLSALSLTSAFACEMPEKSLAKIEQIEDAWTIALNGEKLISLGYIYAPFETEDPDLRSEVFKSLKRLLPNGTQVEIVYTSDKLDRYGRQLADIWLMDGTSISKQLIMQGLALYKGADKKDYCHLAALRKAEIVAKPASQYINMDDPKLLKMEGEWRSVSGRVYSVGLREKKHYLNFGKVWREDFTVEMTPEVSMKIFGNENAIIGLVGKPVVVRGRVQLKGGPMIKVSHAAQIESMIE